jgi:hypothetical protein
MRIWFSIDGEAQILTEAFGPEVMEAFKNAKTDGGKGPPGATGGHQASDKAPVFRDVKGANLKLQKAGKHTFCATLEKNIVKAFNGFIARYPPSSVPFPAAKRTKIAHGCQRIVYVLKNGVASPEKVARGFSCCGQQRVEAVEEPLHWDGSVDYDRIMQQCYADFSAESLQLMRDKVPEMVAKLREDGMVLDAFMDSLGIPVAKDHVNRDGKVVWQQHAKLITHEDSIASFVDYLRLRFEAKDPIFQAARRVLAEAQKRVAAAEKERLKRVEAIQMKSNQQLMKEADTEAFALFPPAEQARRTAAKKMHTAAMNVQKKQDKQAKDADKVREDERIMEEDMALMLQTQAEDELNPALTAARILCEVARAAAVPVRGARSSAAAEEEEGGEE